MGAGFARYLVAFDEFPTVDAILTKVKQHTGLVADYSVEHNLQGNISSIYLELPILTKGYENAYYPFDVTLLFESKQEYLKQFTEIEGKNIFSQQFDKEAKPVKFIPKRELHNSIRLEWDHVIKDNYLGFVTLAVLQDLGGIVKQKQGISTLPLPEWARMQWQGKRWWHSVSPRNEKITLWQPYIFSFFIVYTLGLLLKELVIGFLRNTLGIRA